HADVLQEIKHLKSMIGHQAFRTTSDYLPDQQFAYQHLIDQEVDVQLAQEIMDTVLKQHEENGEMNASQIIMRDIRSEIENRLNDISFQGITYEEQIIHFVGPTGVGKTTTIAK